MNNFRLTSLLTSNMDIDAEQLDGLIESCQSKTVAKGEYLLSPGEICRYSFFVEKGLLRQFGIDERGKEHILQFGPENWFVTDRESAYFNQPAVYFIQALEDSKVLLIDENFLLRLSDLIPSFTGFNNKLLHNHIRQLNKRIYQLLSATAEERYLDFIKMYPDVLLRIPQSMAASYLGITPESLSRVRKELAHRHKKAS
ncbi:MAG: Crp/Fnr family transcriptional regulator [Bacteroidota bacterium]